MKRFRRKKSHWVGWFYDETYRENIDIIWPVREDDVVKFIKARYDMDHKPSGREFGAKCLHVETPDGRSGQIIALSCWDAKNPRDVAMLAHEVFHAAEFMLNRRGCPMVHNATSEPYAYLIESIMRRSLIILDTKKALV